MNLNKMKLSQERVGVRVQRSSNEPRQKQDVTHTHVTYYTHVTHVTDMLLTHVNLYITCFAQYMLRTVHTCHNL